MSGTGTPLGQLKANNEVLSAYFKALAQYLRAGGSHPSLDSVVDSIDYSELLRRATQDANGTADAATAAAVEEVHVAVATLREISMASRTKNELYLAMSSEDDMLSEYHLDKAKFHSSLLEGSSRVPYLQ